MQDLRIILIIIGAIAIAALLIHGLWTSQKGRQKPIREKPMNRVATQTADGKAFDEDGIGKVRVVGSQHSRRHLDDDDEDDIPVTSAQMSAFNNDDDEDEPHIGLAAEPVARPQPKPQPVERARQYEQGEIDPLFDEPEPEPVPVRDSAAQAVAEEMSIDFAPAPERPRTWQDVYVVNLMARPNQQLQGSVLLRVLTALGFKFGEMDIFHRHQSPSGQGDVMFSLINMVKPGTFDPNAMANFTTPGISIFMQLPEPGLGKVHFNLMIQAAETLAEELDGLLFDGERSPLSPDYLAHCREQLRNYDNQLN